MMRAQEPTRAASVEEHLYIFYLERQVEHAPSPSVREGREGPRTKPWDVNDNGEVVWTSCQMSN
jgi:hypothetical protein